MRKVNKVPTQFDVVQRVVWNHKGDGPCTEDRNTWTESEKEVLNRDCNGQCQRGYGMVRYNSTKGIPRPGT